MSDLGDNQQTIFQTPWFSLQVQPQNNQRPVYIIKQTPAVGILARTKGGELLLVRQFRPALGQAVWEIPAGAVDPGETAPQAALRELEEETGYRSSEAQYLGAYQIDSNYLSERLSLFFCDQAEPTQKPPEAGMELLAVKPETFEKMLLTSELSHVSAAASYGQAKLAGLL
ncbi:MAG: hypothetical protein A2527_01740 [Candidatus Lambdaproteobacteria bacterium RIFOXYD2_FULL_50_16]|uniref:GDP-mannose pyrophosphatase n=1 Tax=Candidatus Lambdaproteobacteria bacterium RIFOXYD2_FULL_50_16 TaxID=1817772 RepID=A0A1F6G5U8_9PROT|nr:MAG: hypothetical protein A2527_01740 [Candidatus Lambdaproteobacteria bacterium RIFOXYD2_FULL_50_16]